MIIAPECRQQGCCLAEFCIKGYPRPKFRFGQRVVSRYVSDDDGKTYTDSGIVTGLTWSPPSSREGWWYLVAWERVEAQPDLKTPHFEEAFEDHLEAESPPVKACHSWIFTSLLTMPWKRARRGCQYDD